jgi:type IV pilus assembly protein PilM
MRMAVNTTTLCISDVSMRLMVTRGKRIIKLADMPLDINLSEVDAPEKEARLAEKIKYLFKSNRIGTKKIILGLSGLHCLTRPITLPELPRAMLEEAVTREARRVLPVPVEQLYISWQTVSITSGKLQAFMVAIPRHIADMVIKIVNQAGFKPYIMDIKPLALTRLAKEATAIIIDVQSSEFDIVIMVNGLPQPVRTVPFPKETPSLKERLAIVKDELERTIQFYNSNNQDTKLQLGTPMLVSGELADETELYESLGQELGFKPALLTSPLKCLKHLDPSHHLVNVGLTLKELTREAGPLLSNINTLPTPYQPKPLSINRLLAIPATAAAIGLIILLAMTVQEASANLESTKITLDSNNILMEKRQIQKKELANDIAAMGIKLSGIEEAYKNYTTALNSLTRTGTKMNDDLNTTVNNMVADLDIASLSLSGGRINISGQARSEQEVMQYVRQLTSTGRFTEITISNITRSNTVSDNGTTEMSYTLAVRLKEDKK